MKKPVTVAVSGGFDPIHIGHVHLFRDARALGDRLVVILNDDEWLMRKKDYVFMNQEERKEGLRSIKLSHIYIPMSTTVQFGPVALPSMVKYPFALTP